MAKALFDFAGRRALVTGGRSGIGLACVEILRAGGAQVACLDVAAPDPEASSGVHHVVADVQDDAAVEAAVSSAAKALGGLDLVVLSAGVARDGVHWKLAAEDWNTTLTVNFTGS